MTIPVLSKSYIKPVIIITLIAMLAWAIMGCEGFDWSGSSSTQKPTEETQTTTASAVIKSDDRAILAVYEHLLSQAEGYEAKLYLARFYEVCDKWSATTELFRDGTSAWHVVLDMTSESVWTERSYWMRASWFVFQDGEVIPSQRLQANALKIEADLQELSLEARPE